MFSESAGRVVGRRRFLGISAAAAAAALIPVVADGKAAGAQTPPSNLPNGLSAEQFFAMYPGGRIVSTSGQIIDSAAELPSSPPTSANAVPALGAHCDVIGACNYDCTTYYCGSSYGYSYNYEACYNEYGQFTGYICTGLRCGCVEID
jgi:hypothetical protein